jgi:hypothetical protein
MRRPLVRNAARLAIVSSGATLVCPRPVKEAMSRSPPGPTPSARCPALPAWCFSAWRPWLCREGYQDVAERSQEVFRQTDDAVRENPHLSVGAALGAGVVLGLFVGLALGAGRS